jgi:hypothetical protein
MPNLGSREVMNCTFKNRTTGAPALVLRTLKISNLDFTASEAKVSAGRGNVTHLIWNGDREIKLHVEDGLLNTDMLQILAGATASTAATSAHMYEIKTITSTGSVTAAQTPIGSTGDSKFIFKSPDGVTLGSAMANTAVATADTYQMTGTRFSFDPAGSGMSTGSTILLSYYYTASAATKRFSFTSEDFSDYYTLEAETLWRNDADGLDYPCLITADKVKISDNFSLGGKNTGDPEIFAFDITCMKPTDTTTILTLDLLLGDPD